MDSKRDVLGVLPSLFEEFIDITDKKFYVKKQDDGKFLCFAYDEHKIIDGIKASNLSLSQVQGIYFGQIELESIVSTTAQVCMKISGICLGFSNNILVQVPVQLQVNTDNDIDISTIKLSKHSIDARESSKYITSQNSYMLSLIMIIFAVTIFAKVVVHNSIISSVPAKIDSIIKTYDMPSSRIATNSIISRLDKISSEQVDLREVYKYIFDFKVKNGGDMISCIYQNKSFIIKFKNIKAKKLVDYLEKRYTLTSAVVKDDTVTIGLKR